MEPGKRPLHLQWPLVAGLVAVALLARFVPGQRTVDDAYITFRYARNIVEGNGFVYNPGERTLGTTTPLYTLLLAGLALATGSRDFATIGLVVNALAGGLSASLLFILCKHLIGHAFPAAAIALLWAITPHSVTFAIGGMETDLTIGLLIATCYAHVTGRPRAMATLSALALLARPDTAILLGPLWLDLLLAERRVPWREGLITLAILAPWLVFGTLYFGSPLTASVGAKSITYRLPPEANLIRLLQHYATPFFETESLPPAGVVVAFSVYCGLYALGCLSAYRRNRRSWPLLAYPIVYYAVFAIANPLLFRWYLSPPMPFYILLILSGAWTLARDLGKLVKRHADKVQYAFFALFAAGTLAFTFNGWELHPDHGPDRPAPKMAWFRLELLYKQAADIVLNAAEPNDTLCAGDIGMLGYRTRMPIIDTVGLVTPESSEFYPADPSIYVINYAIPADLVLTQDPDYIVILEIYGRKGLLPDPRFQTRYQLLQRLETNIYGSEGMLIFERK
jgi:hypothetical protein